MRNYNFIFLILLIITNSSFAQQSDGLAPEATAAEAKLSYRSIPDLKKAFVDAAPTDRKDDVLVGELGIDGGNKEMILKLAQEIADNKYGHFDSFLITHKGKLLFESYYSRGRINLPHYQASASKSYISMAIGRAIQMGYLTMADLDKPITSFFKDLDLTKFVQGVEKITLHKAMSMSSGVRIDGDKIREIRENPDLQKSHEQLQAYLENSEPITSESQNFSYGFDPTLVKLVIDAVVPGTSKDFIKKELFTKMGITNYSWETYLRLTSRDMTKWGTLVINKGKWQGKQLVPAAFITRATSKIVRQSDDENFLDADNVYNTGYGYFWWQADLSTGYKDYFSKAARGGGGQYIVVIEELDLVVVVTASNRDNKTSALIATRVLPAFIQNHISNVSGKNYSQDDFPSLEGGSLSQKAPGLVPQLFAPGSVYTEKYLESEVLFSPDMKELYFTRKGGEYKEYTLFAMQYKNNKWNEASIVSIDEKKYKEQFEPTLEKMRSFDVFKDIPITGFTISAKGTYYFYHIDFGKGGIGHMSYSRLINGKYEKPIKMSKAINTGKYIAHPFIAPDESYLMWDAEKNGDSTPDIYISFRGKDGVWGDAINLGDKINTPLYEQRAKVSPDGKYLFFYKGDVKHRKDGSRYVVGGPHWVDAQLIENLRPKQ
ncbi:MAG: serine hydrolase [Flavobacteriaceae bacterium]|nr:serine hydrolase [Flavobacteriaceae bacterium]